MSRNKIKSLFGRGFTVPNCKSYLDLTVSRVKVLRKRAEVIAKQSRLDVAQLLRDGQQTKARNKAAIAYKDENTLAAYDLIQQYCDLIANHLPILSTQRFCPLDTKHAVSGLIYAASRCAELHELQKIRNMFKDKYGKDFVIAAEELRPDCGVSRQIVEKFSSRSPAWEEILQLMKEIAAENKIEWDPLLLDDIDEPERYKSGFSVPSEVSTAARNDFVLKPVKVNNTLSTSSSSSSDTENNMPPEQERVKHVKDSPIPRVQGGLGPTGNSSAFEQNRNADPYATTKTDSRQDYEIIDDVNFGKMDQKNEGDQRFESVGKQSNLDYNDVPTAAQVAYESAAQAAAAAQIVLDLINHGPKKGLMNKITSAAAPIKNDDLINEEFVREDKLESIEFRHNKKATQTEKTSSTEKSGKLTRKDKNFLVRKIEKVAQVGEVDHETSSEDEYGENTEIWWINSSHNSHRQVDRMSFVSEGEIEDASAPFTRYSKEKSEHNENDGENDIDGRVFFHKDLEADNLALKREPLEIYNHTVRTNQETSRYKKLWKQSQSSEDDAHIQNQVIHTREGIDQGFLLPMKAAARSGKSVRTHRKEW